MIKAETEKAGVKENEEPKPRKSEETAGSAAQTPSQKLAEEAEAFCQDLERFFRKTVGEVPKASDLGEIRAQQATVRDLVHRASHLGGGNAEQVAALTAERDKLKDSAARARADFLNYQSRTAKDLERAEELALRSYVSELLPILDSLDLTLSDAATKETDVERLRQALDMISLSLKQVLTVRGLQRIEAKGKPFDPTVHEAVVKRPADPSKGEKPNTVLEELRAGYLWKGLPLRPAQVLVAEPEKK
ncbi:MAG TPA: nucleotide exchange factor GrpE [Planctomycetota bacterium]|nr:nucleotide exchange factor GrpE [Planctomycetota bacterium]